MYQADEKRYETMQYNRCGNSGLLLPELSLGLWHNFGTHCDYKNMKALCFTAFDHGITHFDLANNYGPEPGSAERNFGRILKEDLAAYRDEILVSTKAGYVMWDGPYGNWGSKKYLIASLDQSLKEWDWNMSISSIITAWIRRHRLRRPWKHWHRSSEAEKHFMQAFPIMTESI